MSKNIFKKKLLVDNEPSFYKELNCFTGKSAVEYANLDVDIKDFISEFKKINPYSTLKIKKQFNSHTLNNNGIYVYEAEFSISEKVENSIFSIGNYYSIFYIKSKGKRIYCEQTCSHNLFLKKNSLSKEFIENNIQ